MAMEPPAVEELQEQELDSPIPSMLTTSAVEMMETFTTDIIEIKAKASSETTNPDSVLREFGFHRKQTQSLSLMLDYQQIREYEPERGVVVQNPLTEAAIDEITHELSLELGGRDMNVEPDLAVSKLVVNITSEALEAETRARSDEFELTFVSDPAQPVQGDDMGSRSLTRRCNNDRGLYTELGFDIRNLNLRRVEETQAKYADQGDPLIMSWQGPGDTRPRSDRAIASIIVDEVCPDDYAATKWFGVSDADDTELVGIRANGGVPQ